MRVLLIVLLAALSADRAGAELAVSPLRQALTPENPVVTYRVSNPSSRIVEARASWTDLTATEAGYLPATARERETMSAAPYLTVFPASFRLEPGASAEITVALRDPARFAQEKKPVEKRSHLLIQTRATRTPLRKASGGLELDIGLGVTTPVVLRAGRGVAKARIGDTRLLRTPEGLLELETSIEPDGAFSAYGRLDILITEKGREGAPRWLATIDNAAAWRDAPRRRYAAPLGVKALPAGVMEIRYIGLAEFEGETFATRAFDISAPSD